MNKRIDFHINNLLKNGEGDVASTWTALTCLKIEWQVCHVSLAGNYIRDGGKCI